MRIAVCDDSDFDRAIIVDLLDIYFLNRSISYDISQYSDGQNLIYEVADGCKYDIVFLDIYMEKMLGIDVARKLREMNYKGKIIFLTASPDFAVEGYEVDASGYILKEQCFDKLYFVMNKVLKNYGVDSYYVQKRNNITLVPYQDILFVVSDNSKCILHCLGGNKYTVYKKLSEIENELCNLCFLRSHQSYLVNMNYINFVSDCDFKLSSGDIIPIRTRNCKEIRQIYLNYVKDKKERFYRVLQTNHSNNKILARLRNDIKRML